MVAIGLWYNYIFISAWGLRLLVLTNWAIPTASEGGTSKGTGPTLFLYLGMSESIQFSRICGLIGFVLISNYYGEKDEQ